jgi:lipopolysaccharide/colanic/teichoic acid biosynthesis glycosyltransferase
MPARIWGRAGKRLLDVALCIATLPITIPLAAVIAIAVKVTSQGPVIYRADRVGRYGRRIVVLKFRTMRTERDGPRITRSGDHRITPIGRFLRASKLDEIPQIVNVLCGDMSIVGPRPEDPAYVAAYSAEQRHVLSVLPGMTCLAFLRLGHDQAVIERAKPAGEQPFDVESYYMREILPEKLDIELAYVREWSLRGDIRIIAHTFGELIRS